MTDISPIERLRKYVEQDRADGRSASLLSIGLLTQVLEHVDGLEATILELEGEISSLEGEINDWRDCVDGKQP